jgi:hypothetical protein
MNRAALRLRLPRNWTVRLWIRQTAATRRARSIHELRVFRGHRPAAS